MGRYLYSLGAALSILVNALVGGLPTQTLSARADVARARQRRWGCVLCAILDSIERDHCKNSREWFEGKR